MTFSNNLLKKNLVWRFLTLATVCKFFTKHTISSKQHNNLFRANHEGLKELATGYVPNMLSIMRKHSVSQPESILLPLVEVGILKCDKQTSSKQKDLSKTENLNN